MNSTKKEKPLVPNLSLQQVRSATGMSQEQFGSLVDFSRPYIQAVELGQRPPAEELIHRVAMQTGVWPPCIAEKWIEAVDFNGDPYTAETFARFKSAFQETVNADDIDSLLAPAKRVLLAAAKVGKTRMAAYYLWSALARATNDITVLDDRISEILRREEPLIGKLTVGELRANPQLAAAVGFKDDPRRSPDEVIVLKPQSEPSWSPYTFFPTTMVPTYDEIHRKYLARVNSRQEAGNVNAPSTRRG